MGRKLSKVRRAATHTVKGMRRERALHPAVLTDPAAWEDWSAAQPCLKRPWHTLAAQPAPG